MITNTFGNSQNPLRKRSGDSLPSPAELLGKLKAKQDAIRSGGASAEPTAVKPATPEKDAVKAPGDSFLRSRTASNPATADAGLSPEEKRQNALKKILEKLDAEEAARYPRRTREKNNATAKTDVAAPADPADAQAAQGVAGFLNNLPLFNEFKTGLMDAFKRMDSADSGFISAQYELNYSSMQYIADAAGNFEYKETSFSLTFNLNYVKAAAGGKSGAAIADAIDKADDFESLMNNLQEIGAAMGESGKPGKGIPGLKDLKPEDFLSSMQDYFSPEKTAGRIVDFASAFFPLSDAYKKGGDSESARGEFAEIMRKAIQKGFDQAMGKLGSIPRHVQEGIDKTHDLTFKGIDDFVKNGRDKAKETNGLYTSLENFAFSFEMKYNQKNLHARTFGYDAAGASQPGKPSAPAVDTQA